MFNAPYKAGVNQPQPIIVSSFGVIVMKEVVAASTQPYLWKLNPLRPKGRPWEFRLECRAERLNSTACSTMFKVHHWHDVMKWE